jgi:hypothetical protein
VRFRAPLQLQKLLGKKIKSKVFDYSLKNIQMQSIWYYNWCLNENQSELGYKPVPFSELTTDPSFWKGCLH